jgi:hypothetical protein
MIDAWATIHIESGREPGGAMHLWPRANWHETHAHTVGSDSPSAVFVLAHADYTVPFSVEADALAPV